MTSYVLIADDFTRDDSVVYLLCNISKNLVKIDERLLRGEEEILTSSLIGDTPCTIP